MELENCKLNKKHPHFDKELDDAMQIILERMQDDIHEEISSYANGGGRSVLHKALQTAFGQHWESFVNEYIEDYFEG